MIVFTFPGQGSQKPGVGSPWVDHPSWSVVDAASEALGADVGRLLLDAGADELRRTDNAQLATYVASLVVNDAAQRAGLRPAAVAGHSLGEYTALTVAGVISLADGVRLVQARGAAMLEASTSRQGTMAALLGASDDVAEAACADARSAGHDVWVANYNAPGQVVLAGSAAGIDAAGALAKDRGAKRVMPVSVSGAFHTPYMAPAQAALDEAIAGCTFLDGSIPVGANVDGELHRGAAGWPERLSRQLCSPVRWSPLLGALAAAGGDAFVELGPGAVLTGLAKRTLEGATTAAAASPDELEALPIPSPSAAVPSPPTPATAAGASGSSARTEPAAHTNGSAPTSGNAPANGSATSDDLEGETLYTAERLVVSPAAGVFLPRGALRDGDPVFAGDVLGQVGEHAVRSRFSGQLMGLLAWQGERVASSQPIAWLRVR